MKIAVLSDVHGNVPALDAVLSDIAQWRPDRVVVNGDLVSRGPYSLECLSMLQAREPGAVCLKGNHEGFVQWCGRNPPDHSDPRMQIQKFAYWTRMRLGDAVGDIEAWPDHLDWDDLEGGSFHITHGSRLGDRDGIRPELSDDELAPKLGDSRDVFIGSHTHRPLVRNYNDTLVVNTGSVGQPFDRDPRAAYAQLSFSGGRWRARIQRVVYDKTRAEQDFVTSGFLDECGPLARLILLELQQSRVHVAVWMARYLSAVREGDISFSAAIENYIRSA